MDTDGVTYSVGERDGRVVHRIYDPVTDQSYGIVCLPGREEFWMVKPLLLFWLEKTREAASSGRVSPFTDYVPDPEAA